MGPEMLKAVVTSRGKLRAVSRHGKTEQVEMETETGLPCLEMPWPC